MARLVTRLSVLAALTLGTALGARAAQPAVEEARAYPRRIEVGTVLELAGTRLDRAGRNAILRWTALVPTTGQRLSLSRPAIVESAKRITYRITHADFEALGRPRADARGTLELVDARGQVHARARSTWRLFPANILAARGSTASYLLPVVLALALAAFFVVFALLYAGPITWLERRVAARMQSRVGPNRVGPQGLLQWLADGLKGVTKEDIIPTEADGLLFRVAPYLVFSPVFATFAVLPLSANWVATDLDVGLLFAVSVTSIVVPGLLMAGWSSNNKWSLFGGMRAAAQIVSYEVPATLALLTAVVAAGSLSLQDLIRAQGGAPWNWAVFHSPFTFIAFFLFFASALAEGNRAPFDLPEAESELVSGYNTEYSGMRFLLFFVAEYVNIYVMTALTAAVFLGGWRVPLVSVAEQEASVLWQLVGMGFFLAKVSVLSFVVIWLRWTLPRPRVDQLMVLCWKYFLPFALLAFLGASLWTLTVSHVPALEKSLRLLLFGCGAGLVGWILYRAYWHFRHTHAKLYLHVVDR